MQIKVSFVKNNKDNYPVDKILSSEEFRRITGNFIQSSKEEAPGMIGGHFGGQRRQTENLLFRSLLILDIDSYNGSINDLEVLFRRNLDVYRYEAHSTASSSKNSPRIRIILFFSRDVKTSDYKNISTNFINILGPELQKVIDIESSTSPNRLMYLPIKPHDEYEPWDRSNEGKRIDPDLYLNDTDLHSSRIKDQFLVTVKNTPLDISEQDVINHLDNYPVEERDYHEWLEVGAALHHQFRGEETGLRIWDKWSKKDTRLDKYKGLYELAIKWAGFKNYLDNPVTFGTVIYKTNRNLPVVTAGGYVPVSKSKWIDTKGKNKIPYFTEGNFRILLEEYKIEIRFDIIKKAIAIWFDGARENDVNAAITQIKLLCELNSLKVSYVNEVINLLGSKNTFNSWHDWIYSRPWDGTSRFDDFCKTVEVKEEYEKVRNLYLKKWFLQLVNVTCLNDSEDAKVARMILVFQGKQYSGKTSWFRSLVPAIHNEFVTEATSLKISESMSVLRCIQHVMVELGEINSTMKKSDSEELKNFLSSTKDTLNIKYIAHPVTYRRRTVFFGSVNENEFLHDQTDNTRFLCLPIISCDYKHNIDMQQIYMELIEMSKTDNDYFLNKEDLLIQQEMNVNFKSISILEEKLKEIFEVEKQDQLTKSDLTVYNATNLLEELGFNINQMIHKKNLTNEMAKVLDAQGLKRSNHPRGWFLPPKRIIAPEF